MKSMSLGVIDPILQEVGAPVEPALQQHRPAGIARSLEAGFEFGFKPFVLFG
jgi:hypothetical protein